MELVWNDQENVNIAFKKDFILDIVKFPELPILLYCNWKQQNDSKLNFISPTPQRPHLWSIGCVFCPQSQIGLAFVSRPYNFIGKGVLESK